MGHVVEEGGLCVIGMLRRCQRVGQRLDLLHARRVGQLRELACDRQRRGRHQVAPPAAADQDGGVARLALKAALGKFQQRRVIYAAQPAVADKKHIEDLLHVPFPQERIVPRRWAGADAREHFPRRFGIRLKGEHRLLRAFELCGGDHLHGFCDLARALHAFDACADRPDIGHALSLLPSDVLSIVY